MQRDLPLATRPSGEERREEILEAAISEFARYGFHGSSTDRIAKAVRISQPYVFKLFTTKKELFIAAIERVCDRIQGAFQDGLSHGPGSPLEAMGCAYETLLSQRDDLLVLLHGFAAAADNDVRVVVHDRYHQIIRFVREASGASDQEIEAFFGQGMLLTIAMAIDLEEFLP